MSEEVWIDPRETVITVTWLDGKVQVYRKVSGHQVETGVLTIDGFTGGAGTLHLPLASIRQIAVEVTGGGLRRS
jgi:hypothetical protein